MIYQLDCVLCQHYRGRVNSVLTCVAFPSGIPKSIVSGAINHFEPIEGDNGIVFEPKPEYSDLYPVSSIKSSVVK